jgi:hypothetical protein
MARRSNGSNMSIAQLEQMLAGRKAELNQKQKEHNRLSARLQQLEGEIRQLGGSAGRRGGRGGGTRARNENSLLETLESVLKSNGKPMKVGDIADAAQKSGYRSNSANFRSIVNQTLIKDKRFTAASRGVYQLKKAS